VKGDWGASQLTSTILKRASFRIMRPAKSYNPAAIEYFREFARLNPIWRLNAFRNIARKRVTFCLNEQLLVIRKRNGNAT
jgi:hypothetical protein